MSPMATTALITEFDAADAEITQHLETCRAAARAMNALGALASRVQGAAQDAEFDASAPKQRQPLLNLLQRTGFVNLRSGELATRLRDIHQGLMDLRGDVRAARAAFTTPPATGGSD